jgi:iron complex outermembrane receptor protein
MLHKSTPRALSVGALWSSLAIGAPAVVAAQSAGLVRGTVSAAGGAPIQGARAAVLSPSRQAITAADGKFVIRALPAGTYDVEFSALGYKAVHKSVTVTAGATATLDAALEAGSLMLSSVITSATRSPIEARKVAATVNVLTPEQIATSPARETQDLLREIPGVELPRTSSVVGGTAQIVSIRGVDEGRTVVTADGIPINDAWGEWIDWSKLPKGSVERVEVLEGGSSSLYGNGGIGGAISFFTRQTAPGSVRLTTDGGSRNSRHIFASVGVPLGDQVSLSLTGDYGDGGGYQIISKDSGSAGPVDRVSQSVRRNALARLEYAPSSKFSLFVTAHTFNDNRDLGSALAVTSRNANDGTFGVNYGSQSTGLLTARAWDSEQNEDQYTSSITAVSGVARSKETKTAWLHIPTRDIGGGVQWSRDRIFGLQSFTVGADYRRMTGNTSEIDYSTTNGSQTAYLYSGGTQVLSGAFANAVYVPVKPVSIELSARYDHWGNNDGFAVVQPTNGTNTFTNYDNRSRDAFSPRGGVRWQVVDQFALHAAAYEAFRAPNLAELYRRFTSGTTVSLPNPSLKPEFGVGYETGFDWQPASWVQLKGTGYNVDMRDFNTFVTISTGVRQRLNVQQSRARGGEAYLALRPIQPLYITASLNYLDAKIVSGPTGTVVGTRIGRVPVQRQNVRVTYTSRTLGAFTVTGRHEGVTTTLQGVPLAPFTLYDAQYRREIIREVAGFIQVENLTDTKYQVGLSAAINGVVSLGMPRTVRVGLDVVHF